ncbi:TPA: hypothetical protein DCX15_00045, partial [bacterium]|nr:hypothetical protein [bacterium]
SSAGLYAKEGMDLIDLLIGSEGILGVITQIEIRLYQGRDIISDIAFFESDEEALGFVNALREHKEKGILSLEYFDSHSLDFIRERDSGLRPDFKTAILVEILDNDDQKFLLYQLMEEYHVIDDWYADNKQGIAKHKDFRHSLPEGINSYLRERQGKKLGTDLVVPLHEFPKMLQCYRKVGEMFKERFPREGSHYVIFGHIGDGHLHFNFITHSSAELEYAKELHLELAQKAIFLGGTISGEHGVGKKMVKIKGREIPYLELMYGREGLLEIAKIKQIFDPNSILNVGNMVPREFLAYG